MDITFIGSKLLEGITEHFPQNQAWVPWAATLSVLALGAVLLVKGARLAPKLLALCFLLVGGVLGSHIANRFALPFWPIVISAGVVGAVLAFALFRFLLAGFLAGCAIIGSLAAYGVNVLNAPLSKYAPGLDSNGLVQLPDASAAPANAWTELQRIWTYLVSHPDVPSFQQSFWAIVISTGIAGLTVGLLLPRASRAIWAATAGVLFAGVGGYALLDAISPNVLASIASNPTVGWAILAGIWLVSFLLNLRDLRERRPRITVDDEPIGQAATA